MRKQIFLLSHFFLMFFFIWVLFTINIKSAFAAKTCTITATSTCSSFQPSQDDKYLKLSIKEEFNDPEDVSIHISRNDGSYWEVKRGSSLATYTPSSGLISIDKLGVGSGVYYDGANSDNYFEKGTYKVVVVPAGNKSDDTVLCTVSFEVVKDLYCSVDLNSSNTYKSNDKINFKVNFQKPGCDPTTEPGAKHRVKLKKIGSDNAPENNKYTTSELMSGIAIPKDNITIPTASYNVEIFKLACGGSFDICLPGEDERFACRSDTINIDSEGGSVGCTDDDQCFNGEICLDPVDGVRKCGEKTPYNWGKTQLACEKEVIETPYNSTLETGKFVCHTAIGDINTSPADFMQKVLQLVMGLAGGILLILIIINGYKLMVSQGDPEKIKEAREGIIAAIAGILMIIFALTLLTLLTTDILGIPGFK
jgi:hypothetical protein